MHKSSMLIYCLMRKNVKLWKLTGINFNKVMFTHTIMRILITRTICNIYVYLTLHGIRKDSWHHHNIFNFHFLIDNIFQSTHVKFYQFVCLHIETFYKSSHIYLHIYEVKFTLLVSSFFLQHCSQFIFLFRAIKNLVFDAHYRSSSSEQQIKQRCDVYLGCY